MVAIFIIITRIRHRRHFSFDAISLLKTNSWNVEVVQVMWEKLIRSWNVFHVTLILLLKYDFSVHKLCIYMVSVDVNVIAKTENRKQWFNALTDEFVMVLTLTEFDKTCTMKQINIVHWIWTNASDLRDTSSP